MNTKTSILALGVSAGLLAACGSMAPMTSDVPVAIAVPAGHQMAMRQVGAGELTYECRVKTNMPGSHEWVFAGPNAVLYDANRSPVGKYYGGPTWESSDGSKVTGKQLAVAPGPAGAIPLQLVQANPATGTGSMSGVTYIQRVNTQGGIAPTEPCDGSLVGTKRTVKYQADYVYYKAR